MPETDQARSPLLMTDDPALQRVRLLTARQVAEEILSVHVSTVWRLVQRVENPLPCVRFGERITRFRLSEVERWIEKMETLK